MLRASHAEVISSVRWSCCSARSIPHSEAKTFIVSINIIIIIIITIIIIIITRLSSIWYETQLPIVEDCFFSLSEVYQNPRAIVVNF